MNQEAIEAVRELLANPKKILLTTHRSPDGDAIGSSVAMYFFLKKLGHEVNMIVPDPVPDFLMWMEGSAELVVHSEQADKSAELLSEAEVLFSLDYNAYHRTGGDLAEMLTNADVVRVLIDHHQQPDPVFDHSFSDVEACSTAQLVYEFIEALGMTDKIDEVMATGMYVGIMTDTGSFRFPATTAQTHRIVASLIEHGAKNAEIHQNVFDTNTYDRQKLLGYALGEKLKLITEYNTVILSLSEAELMRFNYKRGDTEGFVNMALSIKGVRMAVFVKESDGKVKMSFRSKGDLSVNALAREHFSGGGHTNAAGGISQVGVEETIKAIENILPQYKSELTS